MHIFFSYSRNDAAVVGDLTTIFAAHGIKCWIDSAGLAPGTPEWDKGIRSALTECAWVIAVCSEHARESNYVAIELAIASGLKKSIFPAWIDGEIWSQSSPMSLVLSQYADIRPGHRGGRLSELLRNQHHALGKIKQPAASDASSTKWPFIEFIYAGRSIIINPFMFETRGHLLTEVYLGLLKAEFPPNTYGETWALQLSSNGDGNEFRLLALPSRWVTTPLANVFKLEPNWFFAAPDCWSGRVVGTHVHESPINIIDLRREEKSFQSSMFGVRAGSRTINAILGGDHPKRVMMEISNRQRDTAVKHAFSNFDLEETKLEGVLVGGGMYGEFIDLSE